MKTKTITLTAIPCYLPWSKTEQVPAWIVETVTDSLLHTPGDYLRKDQVDELCTKGDWKVTIKRRPH